MEVILVVIAILIVLGLLGSAKDHVDDNKERWKRNIKNTAEDLVHEAGKASGRRKMRKAIEQDQKDEIADHKKRLRQIERKIESFKMKKDIGSMTKTEQNAGRKLIDERDDILEKLEELGV